MRSGRCQCVISHQAVRAVLETLLYSASEYGKHPLEDLFLVDFAIAGPDWPESPYVRRYALHEILITAITDELANHRRVFNMRPPPDEGCITEAFAAIQTDARTGNPELIGWSWLYYRFVRVELALLPKDYCKAAGFDERTLRRYQNHAILRLTRRLMAEERRARQAYFRQRLYLELPSPAPVRLFGRQRELALVSRIWKNEAPCHIHVTGAAGVGKTVFIQEAVRGQIDGGQIDYLVWIESPLSVEHIYRHLSAVLPTERSRLSLRDFAAQYEIALILDDIEPLRAQKAALERLLDDLSNGIVWMSSRAYIALNNDQHHLALHDLDQQNALALIRWIGSKHWCGEDGGMSDDLALSLWQQAGGNPGAIRRAVRELACQPR